MGNTLIQFRVDEKIRLETIKILNELGLDLPTYLKMCMTRLNQEKGIPFSMRLPIDANDPFIKMMNDMGEEAKNKGLDKMTLEEINEEIKATRNERKPNKK
mgnify:CR=1 FL=1